MLSHFHKEVGFQKSVRSLAFNLVFASVFSIGDVFLNEFCSILKIAIVPCLSSAINSH